MNNHNFIFQLWIIFNYLLLFFSVVIIIRRNGWFTLFIRLELNTIRFTIFIWKGSYSNERIIKYFLIQSATSILLVYRLLLNVSTLVVLFSLIKLAIVPLHSWGIDLIYRIKWKEILLFFTLQKIGVIFILINYNYEIFLLIRLVMTFGYLLRLKTLRLILFFSSTIHSRWILIIRIISWIVIVTYFLSYSLILYYILINNSKRSILIHGTVPIRLLTLGGLPPFPIFYFKWLALRYLSSHSIIISIILLIGSFLSIVIYFRLFYVLIVNNRKFFTFWIALPYHVWIISIIFIL